MALDAVELDGQHAAVLAALRHLDAADLLRGHRPALVAGHRGDVVDTVRVRHEAVPAHLLRDLLDRAMEVPDVRYRLLHDLAVGTDDEAQHAVRRRVLRAHAERHVLGDEAGVDGPLDVDFEAEPHPFVLRPSAGSLARSRCRDTPRARRSPYAGDGPASPRA